MKTLPMKTLEELKVSGDHRAFEYYVRDIFEKHFGFKNVTVTKRSGDGGFDVRGESDLGFKTIPVIAEAKLHKNKIGPDYIRKIAGSVDIDRKRTGQYVFGFFVTSGEYTPAAVEEAEKAGVTLIDGEKLLKIEEEIRAESGKADRFKETDADIQAAEKIGRIHDGIIKDNEIDCEESRHGLNIFLTRLVYCMFAEDTGIFEKDSFKDYIEDAEKEGRQWNTNYINDLFKVLDTEDEDRSANLPEVLLKFPYVNGQMFSEEKVEYRVFKISTQTRREILECCGLNWANINPDIFGSIFQAVVDDKKRSNMGQHYTSVPNIRKVLDPLFLNSLKAEFKAFQYDRKALRILLERMANIRVFDPACGSGNFLIIAYKEMRLLEIEVLKRLRDMKDDVPLKTGVDVKNFYGIELEDFAHELAVVSLWIAEHQMNREFHEVLHRKINSLPLKRGNGVVCANALQKPWEEVCPKSDIGETYVLGNPPFLGRADQSPEQKADKDIVFEGFKNYKLMDFVACWFEKASRYIKNSKAKFALVSTNSICQGEQVHMLWPRILARGQSIDFAYQSFKWENNAKDKAAVSVIIIGVANQYQIKNRLLFENGKTEPKVVENISPYLTDASDLIIFPEKKHMFGAFSKVIQGNMANDGGALLLEPNVYEKELARHPELEKFTRTYIGGDEFIKGKDRYCLWITAENKDDALKIPFIAERVKECEIHRLASKNAATRKKASTAWEFDRKREQKETAFLIPRVSTKNRDYIPFGIFGKDTLISDRANIVMDPDLFVFGLLSSHMHILWVGETSGEMGDTGFSYSIEYSLNTFPVPSLTPSQKQDIEAKVNTILDIRGKWEGKGWNIARMYDPKTMPDDLRDAHGELDVVVERCYRDAPFLSDQERIDHLFAMYREKLDESPDLLELDKTPDVADIDGK